MYATITTIYFQNFHIVPTFFFNQLYSFSTNSSSLLPTPVPRSLYSIAAPMSVTALGTLGLLQYLSIL